MGLLTTIFIMLACAVAGAFLWLRVIQSKNGERYMKERMQGPFVPDSSEAENKKDKH